MRGSRLGLTGLALVLSGACAGTGSASQDREAATPAGAATTSPTAGVPARSGVRPCKTEIIPAIKPTTSARRPSTAIRFGRRGGVPDADLSVRAEGGGLLPVKLPLAVAASTKVTVVVPAAELPFASLLYDPADWERIDYRLGFELSDADLQTTFRGCRGHETWFNGGFLVTEARCVQLDVYARGRVERVRVPFGVPGCAGDRWQP